MVQRLALIVGRVPRWMWAALGVWIVLGSALTWQWMLSPGADSAGSLSDADAVVVFVGGRGERLETALGIIETGVAEVLVIPNGATAPWPAANDLCAGRADVEVICPDPDPDTTRGEARLFGELASDRGWTTLIMVTSTYHLTRAELLLARCFDGAIMAVAANPDISTGSWVRNIVHEWFGHAQARLMARDC